MGQEDKEEKEKGSDGWMDRGSGRRRTEGGGGLGSTMLQKLPEQNTILRVYMCSSGNMHTMRMCITETRETQLNAMIHPGICRSSRGGGGVLPPLESPQVPHAHPNVQTHAAFICNSNENSISSQHLKASAVPDICSKTMETNAPQHPALHCQHPYVLPGEDVHHPH